MESMHRVEAAAALVLASAELPPGTRVVAGVSGGADSSALLAVLCRLGYRPHAVICNYGLRGAESIRDAEAAAALAQKLGATYEVVTYDDTAAGARAAGASLEMHCRTLRYAAFRRAMEATGAAAIALGHHLEDQVETLLLNLLRRTGITGAGGMHPWRAPYVRPLLHLRRADLEQYLSERGLSWVIDSSNLTDDFLRNRLRHHVLPSLLDTAPDAAEALDAAMGHLREDAALLDTLSDTLVASHLTPDSVDIAAICALPGGAPLLYRVLRRYGFNREVSDDIYRSRTGSALTFRAGTDTWHLDSGMLRRRVPLQHPTVTAREVDAAGWQPPGDNSTACFGDLTAWHVRPWRDGDRMRPYGMHGSKLVSDLLREGGVEAHRRPGYPVVTDDDGRILWLPGIRRSALYPVTAATRRVLCLSVSACV